MGPFWNIWGLSWKVFVSFSDLPLHYSGIWVIFSLKILPITNQACSRYFCQRKTSIGSFRESLKPDFYHQSWKATISSWSCDCVSASSYAYYVDDAPTVAWTSSGSLSSAATWRARACGSSKCPPPARLNQENHVETWASTFLSSMSSSSSVFVGCMPHRKPTYYRRDDDRSTVTLTTRETRWCLFCRLSPWLKASFAKFFKGIWVSRLWSCLVLRRTAALVTDSPKCDVFFTRWFLWFCFEESANWWVLCCSIAG